MTPAELRALVADALVLWGAGGKVEIADPGVTITLPVGVCRLWAAEPDARPVRWWIETPERRAAGRGPRPASSIVAALAVVRSSLPQ